MSGYHPAPCYDPLGSAPNLNCPSAVLTLASDNRSQPAKSGSGHQWRFWFVLAGALLVPACAPRERPQLDDSSLNFREVVGFQTHNLTTDLISVPEQQGLAAVDYGWQRNGDPHSNSGWLTTSGKAGRLRIFSADGDLEEMELELSLAQAEQGESATVQIRLNNHRLDRIRPTPQWTRHRIPIPSELVREGINIITVAHRSGNRQKSGNASPQLRLRRVRFRSRSDRTIWPDRPPAISTDDDIEMPIAAMVGSVLYDGDD